MNTEQLEKLREALAREEISTSLICDCLASLHAFTDTEIALAGYRSRDAEVAALSNWKAGAMAVEASWDPQAVAKALGLPLG